MTPNSIPDAVQTAIAALDLRHQVARFYQEDGAHAFCTTVPALATLVKEHMEAELEGGIHLLPRAARLMPEYMYGIVAQGYVNLRREPANRSELMSQLLYGWPVSLVDREGDWYLVQHHADAYIGWVHHKGIMCMDLAGLKMTLKSAVQLSEPAMAKEQYGLDIELPLRLPAHSLIDPISCTAYKKQKPLVFTPEKKSKTPDLVAFLSAAMAYQGTPYLWGGCTEGGIDCSGLVQQAARAIGILLPRDANQQCKYTCMGDYDGQAPYPAAGNLLFMGEVKGRITHVAISLGSGKYLHADTVVRINSLDSTDPLYDEYRHSTVQCIGQLKPEHLAKTISSRTLAAPVSFPNITA